MVRKISVQSPVFALALLLLISGGVGCNEIERPKPPASYKSPQQRERPILIGQRERLITILQTNDIHGGLEAQTNKEGKLYGGMAMFGGVIKAVKSGLKNQFGKRAGVLVLDGGDQFQGTLISNFSEGELMIRSMNAVGYDAAVPGNHDYDFGPTGWLDDLVGPETPDQDNKAVIKKLARIAHFPLVSANTFERDSFFGIDGKKLDVTNVGCTPRDESAVIDWAKVERPEFLEPYIIKKVAGLRVALIGIDHVKTPETTAISNVSDLCWEDEAQAYLRIRNEIGSRADIFVMLLHNGNTDNEKSASAIVEQLVPHSGELGESGVPLVDAVVAGHTHFIHSDWIKGVPIVQSGANGRLMGRVNLIWSDKTRALVRSRTRAFAGVSLLYDACSGHAQVFCQVDPVSGALTYEGVRAAADVKVAAAIEKEKNLLAPLLERRLGIATGRIFNERLKESPLANFMTDQLRKIADADLSILNTGGLRAPIEAGVFTYSALFNVLPFNNKGVLLEMPLGKILDLLSRAARTCGGYGAVMQSGLKLIVQKVCPAGAPFDESAKITRVETLGGEVLLDLQSGRKPDRNRKFRVATLDYLQNGGSGYSDFIGAKELRMMGIFREDLARHLESLSSGSGVLPEFSGQVDGRWDVRTP